MRKIANKDLVAFAAAIRSAARGGKGAMSIPVLLDMNIGDNMDEAFALALACNSPELELIGVSTSHGKDDPLLLATCQLLGAYGKTHIPVAPLGDKAPLVTHAYRNLVRRSVQEYSGPISPLAKAGSVDFMAERIGSVGNVTVISIARQTNIAALLRRYPRIARWIKEIVMMAGWPTQALPESNVLRDPEAVTSVLQSGVRFRMVGYEATLGCVLNDAHLKQLAQSREPGPQILTMYAEMWRRVGSTEFIMHDPLTVGLVCRPSLGRFVPNRILVQMAEGPGKGVVYTDLQSGWPVLLCTEVDTSRFLDFLLERVCPGRDGPIISHDPARWALSFTGAYRNTYYEGWSVADRGGENHILILILQGTLQITVQGLTRSVGPRCIVYIPAGCAYKIAAAGESLELYWLQFQIAVRQHGFSFTPLRAIPGLPVVAELGSTFDTLVSQAEQAISPWRLKLEERLAYQVHLLQLLVDLLSWTCTQHAQRDEKDAAILRAKRYIESHAHEPIDLESVSAYVGMSKYHLARTFRRMYSVSPLKYHRSLCMRKAQELLRLKHLSIKDVAKQVGYSTANAFSRAFHKEVGMSASEYRARLAD
jgi:purine nucleosidase